MRNLPVKVGRAKSLLDNESDPGLEDEVNDDFFEGLTRVRTLLEGLLFDVVDVDEEKSLEGLVSSVVAWVGVGMGVSIVAKVTTFFSLKVVSVKDASGVWGECVSCDGQVYE